MTKASLGKCPLPGLRTRIVTGIAKINFCNAGQWLIGNTVTRVIFLSETIKQKGPRKITIGGLMALPSGRTEIIRASAAIYVAH